MTSKDLCFIISGGRTGTQFLGDRLSEIIASSHSEHEPDVISTSFRTVLGRIRTFGIWHMVFGRLTGFTGLRTIGQRNLIGKLTDHSSQEHLRKSRDKYHETLAAPLVIESNTQLHYVLNHILEVWPEARIISVIRDPRTWIRSWLNKASRYGALDPVRLFPPGRLTPRRVGDLEGASEWASFGRLGRLAWEWQFVYNRLDAHAASNPNARVFRFEDIFNADKPESMRELVEFAATYGGRTYPVEITQNFTSKVQNASTGNAISWQLWTPEQARLVDRLCGGLMNKYGYGMEKRWKKKLGKRSNGTSE